MSRGKKRVPPAASRKLHGQLQENKSRCSPHVARIISLANNHKPYKKFPELLREYGITPENFETDKLLELCREWANTTEEEDFFNTVGKGDVLEALLRERCTSLSDLHLVDEGRKAELARRKEAKRMRDSKG